jgi:hypothetical protein
VKQRRRTKVIPRLVAERSCLKLAYAALQRAAQRWQRVRISELEERQLELLRQQLQPDPGPAAVQPANSPPEEIPWPFTFTADLGLDPPTPGKARYVSHATYLPSAEKLTAAISRSRQTADG